MESVFKLEQLVHCSTNEDFTIEDNMYCSPNDEPGLLLGSVKVTFCAIPKISDEYKGEIIIDVGLSKCLSVPIELKVVSPTLYKLNEHLQSGKLLLNTKSIFNNVKVPIKEISQSPVSFEDKELIKKYEEGLKQAKLYSNDCANVLETTDQDFYYKKLHMLLYLEGDHRRCLLQRYTVQHLKYLYKFIFCPTEYPKQMYWPNVLKELHHWR